MKSTKKMLLIEELTIASWDRVNNIIPIKNAIAFITQLPLFFSLPQYYIQERGTIELYYTADNYYTAEFIIVFGYDDKVWIPRGLGQNAKSFQFSDKLVSEIFTWFLN